MFQPSCNLAKFKSNEVFKFLRILYIVTFMQGNKKELEISILISTFSFSWFVLVLS